MSADSNLVPLRPAGVACPPGPYSPGVRAGEWIFVSGQLASDYETGPAPEIARLNPYANDVFAAEANHALANISAIVAEGGGDIRTDVVRIYQWFTDPSLELDRWNCGEFFPAVKIGSYVPELAKYVSLPGPASTGMAVAQQLVKDTRIQIDCVCRVGDAGRTSFAAPEGVPAPPMPYSPAMRRGDFVYLAGEVATDWVGDHRRADRRGDGDALADQASVNPYFWYESPIEKQTAYLLSKQEKIAESAGTSLRRAVKAEVYLAHPSDFAGFDKVWREWFPENPPARTVIPYQGMAGKGVRVEISFMVLAGDSALEIETISTPDAPKPLGHEPQAVKCADLLFLSTQLPGDADGALPASLRPNPGLPYFSVPARDQVRYLRKNIAAIAKAGGTSIDNTARILWAFDDLQHYQIAYDEWMAATEGVVPASTALGLLGGPMIVPGAHLMLDVTIYAP